jgi:hypothetical protein
MIIGIFCTPEGYEKEVIEACRALDVRYEVIDLFADDWLQQFKEASCDGYILRPPTQAAIWRTTYLKRLLLLREEIAGQCVPTLESTIYYESKIHMADMMALHHIPSAEVHTFFDFRQAWQYAAEASFPVIVKTDGGSGGKGVRRIRTPGQFKRYVMRAFFTSHTVRSGRQAPLWKRPLKKYMWPWNFMRVSGWRYFPGREVSQGYVHVQECLPVRHEWRIIMIGDSYFGHRKLAGADGMHSGTKQKDWQGPPFELLDQVRDWASRLQVNAMCFDIFETEEGRYVVNELQVSFGTSTPHQMIVNGTPGRYVYTAGAWQFEAGDFCRHACHELRIKTLQMLLFGERVQAD